MKISFIPIDNRPVCYCLAKDIAAIDDDIELLIPPRGLLGGLQKPADVESLFSWLEDLPRADAMIISLDTLIYGGLISSRRGGETLEELQTRMKRLKKILIKNKNVYAFSSIMRISNNNCHEEEKEYWKDWGKKIFEYSFSGGLADNGIPKEILEDYLSGRKRNFEINKTYIEWQKEGVFDTLIFSKDDCAERGFNADEARTLESFGGKIKTGADEIPLALLSRAIKKDIKIYPEFLEDEYKTCISNYEDISIERCVHDQLELGGFKLSSKEDADIILVVNNFAEKQGELVMGLNTGGKYRGNFSPPQKPYAAADVRFTNGADNDFVNDFLNKINTDKFFGYAGYNTSANTLGSLLAGIKLKYAAKKYNDSSFKKLQYIRFLDDWGYQANVRFSINKPCDIKKLMKPFEAKISETLGYTVSDTLYTFPWERKFETEITPILEQLNTAAKAPETNYG